MVAYTHARNGAAMTKTRHAIVVTHERLMHRGDVVQGAVG